MTETPSTDEFWTRAGNLPASRPASRGPKPSIWTRV